MGAIETVMLHEFIAINREEIITRCRAKVATRSVPPPTAAEIDHGVPVFLDQLVALLRHGLDLCSGRSGHERHVSRERRRALVGLVVRRQRGRGRRARCRPFLRRGLPCGPVAADGYGDGHGPVHGPGCPETRNGAAPPRPARVRGSVPDSHADEEHPNRRRSDRPASTPARSGSHARFCCSRVTEKPSRLTAHFRECLRNSWPRWSARPGRVSTSS